MQLLYNTKRLILKTLDASNAEEVCQFYSKNKYHFTPWEPEKTNTFYTPEYHKATLTYETNEISNYHMLRLWVYTQLHPDKIIGTICYDNIQKGSLQNCQLSYKIDGEKINNGYATEALSFANALMFKGYKLHRIEAIIHPDNAPSIAVINKLNFEFEGIAKSYIFLDNKWEDQLRYSLISDY